MCGRFYLTAKPEQLKDTFQLAKLPRYTASYNIPPGQKILTIVQRDDHSYKAANLHWGLIPHWAKERKISAYLINARAETLRTKPAFRTSYKQRRCLIPASGFYEWQQQAQAKQAYCISHKDKHLMLFAGLWEYWEHGTETIYSCCIITCPANTTIKPIHQRMPVILNSQQGQDWLNKRTALQTTEHLLANNADQEIRLKPISSRVNNPQHNDLSCLC